MLSQVLHSHNKKLLIFYNNGKGNKMHLQVLQLQDKTLKIRSKFFLLHFVIICFKKTQCKNPNTLLHFISPLQSKNIKRRPNKIPTFHIRFVARKHLKKKTKKKILAHLIPIVARKHTKKCQKIKIKSCASYSYSCYKKKKHKKPLKTIILAPPTLVATRKHENDQNRTKKINF
jgi:hypothetical protein